MIKKFLKKLIVGGQDRWTCGIYGIDAKNVQSIHGKPYRRRPLGRPRCRWDDIKVCLNSSRIGECRLHSSDLGQGCAVGFCEQGNEACGMLPGHSLLYLFSPV
jgi:hypothetical protein